MPTRNADARWNGTLKEGNGTMRMATGSYEGAYTFRSRFEEGEGTNPEELIAAAHAGCFSMKLSADLGAAGYDPEYVETTASVHISGAGSPPIARIDLVTRAKVPGIDEAKFQEVAEGSKTSCPVSQALAAVPEITLDATLES